MQGFWAIYKREVKTYFQSPSTYVVLALLFLFVGWVFMGNLQDFVIMSQQFAQGSMFGGAPETPNITEVVRGVFGLMLMMAMFTVPMLSMRLIAEEKSSGNFELLVTCPIGDWSIILGKYFALMTVGVVMMLISAAYPLILHWAGKSQMVSPEWPIVISCWVGLLLIFGAYAAFGVMASSFTDNQITACVVTFIGLFLWFIVGMLPISNDPEIKNIINNEVAASGHAQNFVLGAFMLKDFAYYVLFSFLFLFIASKALDSRRWRV